MLWGAAWLHKATRNPTFLSYIQVNGQTLGADDSDNTFGWDNKHVGARILLSKVPFSSYHCFSISFPFFFLFNYFNHGFLNPIFQAFLVQKVQSLHDYKGHADNFICSLVPGTPFSQAQYTPGPVPHSLPPPFFHFVTASFPDFGAKQET